MASSLPGDSEHLKTQIVKKSSRPMIDFTETETAIGLKWDTDVDAEYYKIHFERGDERFDANATQPVHELKRSIYNWENGELLRVVVKKVSRNGEQTSVLHDTEYVIGGDTVASSVRAEIDPEAQHGAILLSWKEPMRKPLGYEVVVFKESSKKEKQRHPCGVTNFAVKGLRQSTAYFCTVETKYGDPSLGKAARSNVIKTLLKNKADVKAWKDPDNPARGVIVNWEEIKPSFKTVSIFHIFLQFDSGDGLKQTEIQKVKEKKQTAFENLKSNTRYTAYVVAYNEKKKTEEFFSEEVVTDRVLRTTSFNIRERGKPSIQNCGVIYEDGKPMSDFSWKLSDLGEEKKNYRLMWVNASYKLAAKSDGGITVPLQLTKDKNSAKPIGLLWGKTYLFRVTCSFLDLDTNDTSDAMDEKVLAAEMGKPAIGNVTWKDEQVTVRWTPAKGAKHHYLKVLDGTKKYVMNEEVSATTRSFDMSSTCNYGKECRFEIEAVGEENRRTTDAKEVLIGGNRAVTNAVAIKSEENPRRGIIVRWKAPVEPPEKYKLELYELDQKAGNTSAKSMKIDEQETKTAVHKFKELKSKTTYCCKISPIYSDVTAGGTLSCLVETDKRKSRGNESLKDFGTPENILHSLEPSGSEWQANLQWTKVELSENYKLLNFHIDVSQKGRFFDSVVFQEDFKAECNHANIPKIKTGYKFTVQLKTVYRDCDSLAIKEAKKEYSFDTKPREMNLLDCELQNDAVYFRWTPVDGAVKYTLILKDDYHKQSLAQDHISKVTEGDDGCHVKVRLSNELCIGKTCVAKVRTHNESGLTSDSEWKRYLIGGDEVPRNVKASTNSENPRRSARITFDAPNQGTPDQYEILAKPLVGGREKREKFCTSPAIFDYLREATSYIFTVSAVKDNRSSEGSTSNKITTARGNGRGPLLDFHATGGEHDFRHSTFEGRLYRFCVTVKEI